MNEHPSRLVFEHLGRFLESRGLAPADEKSLDVPRDKFITELNHLGYFRLVAVEPGSRAGAGAGETTTVILILAIQGRYTDVGPNFRSLVSAQGSNDFAREGRLSEVIVIAPEAVMLKKNMTDVIAAFRVAARGKTAAPGSDGGPPPPAEFYNMYSYHVFSLDIPRAQIVPLHEIATDDDVKTFLAREKITRRDLPGIASTNPPVVWIGGRSGQVIRVRRSSETAGEAFEYRVVQS